MLTFHLVEALSPSNKSRLDRVTMSKQSTFETRFVAATLAAVACIFALALGAPGPAQAAHGHHGHAHHGHGHHGHSHHDHGASSRAVTHQQTSSHHGRVTGLTADVGPSQATATSISAGPKQRSHCSVSLTETHCETCLNQVALRVVTLGERFTVAQDTPKTAVLLLARFVKSTRQMSASGVRGPPSHMRLHRKSRPIDLQNRFRI